MTKQSKNKVDPRNKLNDLNNREWMISTKSVWWSVSENQQSVEFSDDDRRQMIRWLIDQVGEDKAAILFDQLFPSILLSTPPARDLLKKKHPATFAEKDIEKLIMFFTKQNEYVLDPFVGSGSTLVACNNINRNGVGIELVPKWADIARKRAHEGDLPLFRDLQSNNLCKQDVIEGDAREELRNLPSSKFDFIVTSPPYWKILQKDKDHKATQERTNHGLETKYSEMKSDLGNLPSYDEFIVQLGSIFRECLRVLKTDKYMAVIVSDFRDKGDFYTFHSDIQKIVETVGFKTQGITILAQDNKNLYPYGVPFAFVSNINHQYVLIFQKKNR